MTQTTATPEVIHDQAARRFVIATASGDAYLSYALRRQGVVALEHTWVPASERGRGLGQRLVSHAVAWCEAHTLDIDPACPFVRDWLQSRGRDR